MKKPIWIPSEERVQKSNINAFIRYAEQITHKPVSSYNDLYEWSVTDIEEFWKSIWVNSGIIHSKTYTSVLTGNSMQDTKWFQDAMLNFSENLLKYRDNNYAILSAREGYPVLTMTYSELYTLVAKTAAFLKDLGVKKGDVIAGYIANVPEAIIAMLASASLGALWTSASPDFGFQGVLDRFGQTAPKILFATEKYSYNGQIFNNSEKIKKIAEAIPSIKNVIIVSEYYNLKSVEKLKTEILNADHFSKIHNYDTDEIIFEQLPFNHPVYIMYSSGTTGIPKCIVHGAGGTLLQHYKELVLHTDLNRHDIITYFTTTGWMMWNWLVSSLMTGASIFLYDGNPVYPEPSVLWRYISEEKITIFGTSPRYLSSIEKIGIVPKDEFNLSSLRTILSTGAPLAESNFNWVYNNVKEDIQLSSISGGTDIISCFMLGCPILPVFEGEIQCRGLGMKVEAYDDNSNPVIEQKGELVCTKPFPSMPVYFWNDPDGEKYRTAYFDFFPGVWRHGDYIKITSNGGVIVYGRSDATLNPGGVRIGTAEIYRIVEEMDEVKDSLAVGYSRDNNIDIILFVQLKENIALNEELKKKIKEQLRTKASPRHVPHKIFPVSDIPRTINGKKVEVAVTRLLQGESIDNRDALANPEALNEYFQFTSLLIKEQK